MALIRDAFKRPELTDKKSVEKKSKPFTQISSPSDGRLQVMEYPSLPQQIKIKHLKLNDQFVSNTEKQRVHQSLSQQHELKTNKGLLTRDQVSKLIDSKFNCDVVYMDSEPYFLYPHWEAKGSFGSTQLAQNRKGEFFVLKKIAHGKYVEQEFKNLVKLNLTPGKFETVKTEVLNHKVIQRVDFHYLLMNLGPGIDCVDFLNEQSNLPANHPAKMPLFLQQRFVYSFLQLLEFLQKNGFIHCDIKLDNLLFHRTSGKLSLIDFGLSFQLPKGSKKIRRKLASGTLGYAAPEVIDQAKFSKESDIFAAGILSALFLGLGKQEKDINVQAERGHKIFADENETAKFLQEMANLRRRKRPAIKKCIEFFQKQLGKTPKKMNVGIFSIEDYFSSADHPEQRAEIVKELHRYNEVWIINPKNKYTNYAFYELEEFFAKHCIPLGKYVFSMDPNKMDDARETNVVQRIPHAPEVLAMDMDFKFSYITSNKVQPVDQKTLEARGIAVVNIKDRIFAANSYATLFAMTEPVSHAQLEHKRPLEHKRVSNKMGLS